MEGEIPFRLPTIYPILISHSQRFSCLQEWLFLNFRIFAQNGGPRHSPFFSPVMGLKREEKGYAGGEGRWFSEDGNCLGICGPPPGQVIYGKMVENVR